MKVHIDDYRKQQLLDLPIEDIARKLGIRVTRHRALCFMHDDHHPSMVFYPDKNKWKCYVCNVWGDTISLVMKYNNQSYVEACVWLAHEYGIDIEGSHGVDTSVRQRPQYERKTEAPVTLDTEVLAYIVDTFGLTPSARQFLFEERGYKEEVVRKLRVCSMDDERVFLDALVKKFGVSRILKCQLAYRNAAGLRSYFHAPCLFFPYMDSEGHILGLQARFLGDSEKFPRFQFPKGSSTHIFNQPIVQELSEHEPLFVSEGVTDTMALMSAGYKAVAIPSATLLKTKELELISSHPLLMYPDNDEPGEKLAQQIAQALETLGGHLTRLSLPRDCKDYSMFYQANVRES